MSISKKIRFEVFKRDGFKCQYCGGTPPDCLLEVDHIQPKSKEGSDDINNLITSCFDCNRGKSNVELTRIPQTLFENIDTLKEQENQLAEYQKLIRKIERRKNKEINEVEKVFQAFYEGKEFTNAFRVSVKTFIKRLSLFDVKESMEKGCSKIRTDPEGALKYFCGICWTLIRGSE